MHTHFNPHREISWITGNYKKRLWLILFMIFIIRLSFGQNYPVTISIAVTPPYTSKVNDYVAQPNKVMVTIVNTSNRIQTVYVLGSITGEGIAVYTDPAWKMPQPLTLQPGTPFQMNQGNIQQVFSSDHLVFHGITKNEIQYGNGLPEGDYTICLRAYDYNTNQPVSADSPQGCSNPFTVTDIEVPVILQPVCGGTVRPNTPQYIQFSWTRPPGAPVNIQFNLKIIEVLPGDRNINDAMRSATHPVFFEKTTQITSCILGPSDPALVLRKKYAFAVTAIDPAGKATFRNNGISEVCSFTCGNADSVMQNAKIILSAPPNGQVVNDYPLFQWETAGIKDISLWEDLTYPFNIRICEVLPRQTKEIAINNSPHVNQDLMYPAFQCPPYAVEPGKNYCWQVTVIYNNLLIAKSEIWGFVLPLWFCPVINLNGIIVHIESKPEFDNASNMWVVEVLLSSGGKIKVKFEKQPDLKPCDYILIRQATVPLPADKDKIIVIKSWEKTSEAVAKKTWAKQTIADSLGLVDKINHSLTESLKNERITVGLETAAQDALKQIMNDKDFPAGGEFHKSVTTANDKLTTANTKEGDAKKLKEGVQKFTDPATSPIKSGLRNLITLLGKALELEAQGKDDKAEKTKAIEDLKKLSDMVKDARDNIWDAKSMEVEIKTPKGDAIDAIDKALENVPDLANQTKRKKWTELLNGAKNSVSSSFESKVGRDPSKVILSPLSQSIEEKKEAINSLNNLRNAILEAKQNVEEALKAELK